MSRTRAAAIYSDRAYDDCYRVHTVLFRLHRTAPITHLVHFYNGAGCFSTAWSKINKDVEDVIVPDGPASSLLTQVPIHRILVFGSPSNLASIERLAKKHRLRILYR